MKTEAAWIKAGLVKPTDPTGSLLIQKLKPSKSSIATMPPDNSLTDDDYQMLRTWISHIPVPSNEPIAGVEENGFGILPQVIGLEQFLAQTEKVFGRPPHNENRIAAISTKWRGLWGGGCDTYQSSVLRLENQHGPVWENPTQLCNKTRLSDGPLGTHSIVKEGSRMNVCEYFTDSDTYMNEFFSKGIISGSNFTKENARKVFHLYYPAQDFTDSVYNTFVNSAKQAHPRIDGDHRLFWRLYLSTLCQSLYWEII